MTYYCFQSEINLLFSKKTYFSFRLLYLEQYSEFSKPEIDLDFRNYKFFNAMTTSSLATTIQSKRPSPKI